MGQSFLPDTVHQTLLFPPSLHDWLPENHLARFVVDVVSELDLSSTYKSYQEKDGRSQPFARVTRFDGPQCANVLIRRKFGRGTLEN
jgi:hypothetical protein